MSHANEKLASRYANALLKALETKDSAVLESASTAVQDFAKGYRDSPELRGALSNPMFDEGQRAAALASILESSVSNETVKRFLTVVFERGRIAALPEMAVCFKTLVDEVLNQNQVSIITASDVPADEVAKIEKALKAKLGGEPKFSWSKEASILGGMILKYGGKVVDGSLSGKIDRLEKQISNS